MRGWSAQNEPRKSSVANRNRLNFESTLKPSSASASASTSSVSRSPSPAMRDLSPLPEAAATSVPNSKMTVKLRPSRDTKSVVKRSPSQNPYSASSSSSGEHMHRIDALLSAASKRNTNSEHKRLVKSTSSSNSNTSSSSTPSPALTSPRVPMPSISPLSKSTNALFMPSLRSKSSAACQSSRRASVSPSLGLAPPASPLRLGPNPLAQTPSKPTLKRRAYSLSADVMANLRPPSNDEPDVLHHKREWKRRKTEPATSSILPPSRFLSPLDYEASFAKASQHSVRNWKHSLLFLCVFPKHVLLCFAMAYSTS